MEAAARSGADIIYWGGDLLNWNTSVSWPELQSRVDKSSSNHVELVFAYPRITKDEEQKEIEERFLSDRDCLPNWIRIANWGQLATANNLKALVSVDYPMYAFNSASLEFYHKMGASRVTISPELTLDQIAALQKPDGLQIEALVHGQIPVMISDYCPISTVMDGTQSPEKKCSQSLCRIDRYSLRDKLGYNFPVITNSSCRSFIFNSKELCLFDNLEEIIRSGISILRLEAIQRGASYTAQIVSAYRHWIDRHEKMVPLSDSEKDHVKSLLVDLSFNGITKGHYFRGVE